MKGIVIYDSVYGNTKLVAEAIAEQLRKNGFDAELKDVKDTKAKLVDGDFMFIGSPTRIKRMTRRTKSFIKKLDKNLWDGKTIVAFDTYGPLPKTEVEKIKKEKWLYPGAAGHIQELLRSRGFKVYSSVLRCDVVDYKGPLAPESIDKTEKFTNEFITKLRN